MYDFAGVDIAGLDNDGRMCGQLLNLNSKISILEKILLCVFVRNIGLRVACSVMILAIRKSSHPLHRCFCHMHSLVITGG